MLIDLRKLAECDDGTITNARIGAALRLMAHHELANSRPRLIALLGSRYMADNLEMLDPAKGLLSRSVVDDALDQAS